MSRSGHNGAKRSPRRRGVDIETMRAFANGLPGVEQGTCYGTMAFRVRGKLIARLRDDGETLAVKTRMEERDALMSKDPETYYLTDHYREHPWILVRLPHVTQSELEMLLEQAWRRAAPHRLVVAFDATK
jgi:hypothetical protein